MVQTTSNRVRQLKQGMDVGSRRHSQTLTQAVNPGRSLVEHLFSEVAR